MNKTPLLLLHGALGDQQQFDSLASRLKELFVIHRLDFEGHGSREDVGRPFRIEYFAENILTYLKEESIDKVDIFGYSMGGYVALYLAKKEPEKVKRIATLGTVIEWNEDKAVTETVYLHPDKIEEKVPHFARQLQERHHTDWKEVVIKTRELLEHLGSNPPVTKEDLRKIPHPVRIHVGDRDNTAGIEPSFNAYNRLDHGDLAVLPRSSHPIEKINEKWLLLSLNEFFSEKKEG